MAGPTTAVPVRHRVQSPHEIVFGLTRSAWIGECAPSRRGELVGVGLITQWRLLAPECRIPGRWSGHGEMMMEASGHGATVLVVDDDEDLRMVFLLGLGHVGYRVITAATGVDGVRSAHEQRPDVVVMDLSINGADGWEVVRSLKASEDTRDIPIVLVTGHTDVDGRAKAEGCAAYLSKPVRLEVLRTVVDSLVKGTAP